MQKEDGMRYRIMPKNGDRLSILGFGCMRLPIRDGRIDEERAIAQIRHAIDSGVNYVDTAWPYHGGESEPLLGKALRNGYRDKVRVATKLPSWLVKDRADMDRYLDAQLEKLGIDRIDYYLVHSLDGPLWDKMAAFGVNDFLDSAVADGRIVNAGFSFHGLRPDFRRIVDAYPWVFCQIQYNFLDREYQAGIEGLKYAAGQGLGVIVMEPLRGGNIGLAAPPPAVAAIWDESAVRRTPAEWALRWVWNHPQVTLLLSGMNEEAHIAENLAIADTAHAGALTGEELALVDRAGRMYQELMKVGCTGCGYCMPCPAGVMIPACFEVYNKMHMFGNPEEAKFIYALRMSDEILHSRPGYASQCVACGECRDKCPQHIPIPDVLADIAAEMEGPALQERVALGRQIFKAGLS
jgi:predicted aldo/keto reductase-like oxidoreductase